MSTRCFIVALLSALSTSLFAADAVVLIAPDSLGIWLIICGVVLLMIEAALPNYGVVGLGGIVTFVIGAVILTNAEVPVPLMIGLGVISAVLLAFLLLRALKTRPRHAVSGDAGLLGSVTPITRLQPGDVYSGWVLLQGEHWQVLSPTPLQPGERVQVTGRKGLLLEVTAADMALRGD